MNVKNQPAHIIIIEHNKTWAEIPPTSQEHFLTWTKRMQIKLWAELPLTHSLTQQSVNVLKFKKKRSVLVRDLLGRQCSHESHLHNCISRWQFQTGPDRTLQILMDRQRGTQTGLIAVWWLAVSQSQHIIHRCANPPSFTLWLSQRVNKAIIGTNTDVLQLISFERFINLLEIPLLINALWMICHGDLQ